MGVGERNMEMQSGSPEAWAGELYAAARSYEAIACRLRAYGTALSAIALDDAERQLVNIASGACADYLDRGATAAREAAERLGVPCEAPGRAEAGADMAGASLDAIARGCETAARELYDWVHRLGDVAERAAACGSGLGDTHPYGDVVYGIVIPYLARLTEVLWEKRADEGSILLSEKDG